MIILDVISKRIGIVALYLMMALCIHGCSNSPKCVPGQSNACTCEGGETGAQTCNEDGKFNACVCIMDRPNPALQMPSADTSNGERTTESSLQTPSTPKNVELKKTQMPTVEGIPPIALTGPGAVWVGATVQRQAITENSKGIKFHKKKMYTKAIEQYKKSLNLWPNLLVARSNLACAYSLINETDTALAILKQFKYAPDCVECLQWVARADRDSDYDNLRKHTEYRDLLTLDLKYPDYEAMTQRVLDITKNGYMGRLLELTHPKQKLIVQVHDRNEPPGKKHLEHNIDSVGTLQKIADSLRERSTLTRGKPERGQFNKCNKAGCCTFRHQSIHNDYFLKKMCFWSKSEDDIYLTRLEIQF